MILDVIKVTECINHFIFGDLKENLISNKTVKNAQVRENDGTETAKIICRNSFSATPLY